MPRPTSASLGPTARDTRSFRSWNHYCDHSTLKVQEDDTVIRRFPRHLLTGALAVAVFYGLPVRGSFDTPGGRFVLTVR